MRFLTVREAAEKARVTDQTIYRWLNAALIPSYKPGKSHLIKEADLDAFIESARRSA